MNGAYTRLLINGEKFFFAYIFICAQLQSFSRKFTSIPRGLTDNGDDNIGELFTTLILQSSFIALAWVYVLYNLPSKYASISGPTKHSKNIT